MKLRVRLFASYAEAAGFRDREIELPAPATAADVLAHLRRGPLIALPGVARPLFAVNRQHVEPTHAVSDGDEVAIFPPVSGGAPDSDPRVVVTEAPLDARALAEALRSASCGALVTFEGTVRDHSEAGAVAAMSYEAYPEMALGVLRAIRDEVEARHPGVALAVAHRTGRLELGETSVVVACAAPHRREAFAACRLAMDRIKESLPVWKKELLADGRGRWK